MIFWFSASAAAAVVMSHVSSYIHIVTERESSGGWSWSNIDVWIRSNKQRAEVGVRGNVWRVILHVRSGVFNGMWNPNVSFLSVDSNLCGVWIFKRGRSLCVCIYFAFGRIVTCEVGMRGLGCVQWDSRFFLSLLAMLHVGWKSDSPREFISVGETKM